VSRVIKWVTLALYGGALYYLIEAAYKSIFRGGITHWSMAVVGGIMFVALGSINNIIPWNMPLVLQCVIGAGMITAVELVAGLILNVWLGLGIWDYSHLPLNLWGQICLPFSLLWMPLSLVAILLADWLQYWIWGRERPRYYSLRGTCYGTYQ